MSDAAPAAPGRAEAGTISQAGEQRSAHIESLRALGSIMVVLAHVGAATFALKPAIPALGSPDDLVARFVYGGGNAALFLFFAISGYVIYFPFAKRDFGGGGAVNLRRYATNRALRIFPLYFVVVATVLLIQFDGAHLWVWRNFLTFSQSFSDATVFQYIGVTWSLVVELHFYILLPFLAWGVARLAQGSAGRGIAILIGVGLVSLGFRIAEVYAPLHPNPVWRASTIATFLFIIAGMVASIVHVQWQTQRPSWLRGALTRSDLWLLAALPFFLVFAFGRYHYDFGCTIMAFLIIGAASFPGLERGPITRILWWRPLAMIGISAYSIYLWHFSLIVLLLSWGVVDHDWGFVPFAAVILPLSLLVGLISYRVIEEPFLRMRKRWSRAAPRQAQQEGAAQEAPAG